mmetsp:Transcript_71263/g.82905  ORF Transcript_71263/g.82905 Transcript_71263/m.82905 type:complete len:373 (-) Transcript_71263:165-1283(-)|eukprot:CAMPEP_0176437292 /NCGR_PEP_ID=MMETSP0127-20121128/18522_1 /TAXON_ID=938130 /ORGANISM="Platyophrya macrostoma, Strain WH" /LENGTH=372 /DNA_ID=CAMNT_0017820865 /DNA_START=20 /DNA_END=1141 /DNA_ORIENTATION=+
MNVGQPGFGGIQQGGMQQGGGMPQGGLQQGGMRPGGMNQPQGFGQQGGQPGSKPQGGPQGRPQNLGQKLDQQDFGLGVDHASMVDPTIELEKKFIAAHLGEAHNNDRFAELFKETRLTEGEPNPCYEKCIECCGDCQGCCASYICCCMERPYKEVQESQFGIIQQFGVFKEVKGPGLHYINPCCQTMAFVDRKENIVDLPKQSIMTKDNVNIIIDAVVYYQIEDPKRALFEIQNVVKAVAEIAKTTLRDIFGQTTLQEALETKEKMAVLIRNLIDKPTEDWGVNINRVLIQEITFSADLRDNLAAAATAKRVAVAKIIQAQADVDSAKLLKEASDILNTQAAMQIRYLDSVAGLAKSNNTKIIFMPSDAARR